MSLLLLKYLYSGHLSQYNDILGTELYKHSGICYSSCSRNIELFFIKCWLRKQS
jgi:hypothetical protein